MVDGLPLVFSSVCMGVAAMKDGSKILARFQAPLPAEAPRDAMSGTLALEVSPDQAAGLAVGRRYKVTAEMFMFQERRDFKGGGSGLFDRYVFQLVKSEAAVAAAGVAR
jgi:hypothetical protein